MADAQEKRKADPKYSIANDPELAPWRKRRNLLEEWIGRELAKAPPTVIGEERRENLGDGGTPGRVEDEPLPRVGKLGPQPPKPTEGGFIGGSPLPGKLETQEEYRESERIRELREAEEASLRLSVASAFRGFWIWSV